MGDAEARVIEGEEREFIEAEFVNIKQSSVRSVEGGHVELHQVGALSIDGERVEVTQGAAAVINGGDVSFNQGISLVTVSERTTLTSSCSPVLLSMESTDVSRSAVGILGGREIKADNVSSFLMIANKVEGEVTTLFDWRSALAMGAVIGGALGLISLFRKR